MLANVKIYVKHFVWVTLQPVIFPHVSNGTTKSRLIQIVVDEKMSAEIQENRHEQQMPTWTATTTNPFGVLTVSSIFDVISYLEGKLGMRVVA
ncbi:hypothetical protein Y032_0123g1155 [Ancylostoma ceylanicum]|uniref:Uncharacterized protein n=1 Tax=Ancylostoma ceylanicum TaxID=53326 RepID=A0A016T9J5_9BILA|nr:hypothetical protein Y032_0123g1155 [Ancylostoma ceylanicum]